MFFKIPLNEKFYFTAIAYAAQHEQNSFSKVKIYTLSIFCFEFFFVNFQPCIIVKKVACDELF